MSSAPTPLVAAYIRRVLAVRAAKLVEPAVVGRFFEEGSPGELAEGLKELMTSIDLEGYREGYHAALITLLDRTRVPYARLEELYRAAYGAGYGPVRSLLLSGPPRLEARADDVQPDPLLVDTPLGRRKAMARGHDRETLVRLCLDPHPQVVEILLDNPKLVERDLILMASRRPTTQSVQDQIGVHGRWSFRYEVQRTLINNPYTRPALAAGLVPFLRSNHLQEAANDARLHEAVRECATVVGEWRAALRERPSGAPPAAPSRRETLQ